MQWRKRLCMLKLDPLGSIDERDRRLRMLALLKGPAFRRLEFYLERSYPDTFKWYYPRREEILALTERHRVTDVYGEHAQIQIKSFCGASRDLSTWEWIVCWDRRTCATPLFDAQSFERRLHRVSVRIICRAAVRLSSQIWRNCSSLS